MLTLALAFLMGVAFGGEVVVDRFGNEQVGHGLADLGTIREGDRIDLTVRMDALYGLNGWGVTPSDPKVMTLLHATADGSVAPLPGMTTVMVWNPHGNAVAVRRAEAATAATIGTPNTTWALNIPKGTSFTLTVGGKSVDTTTGDLEKAIQAVQPAAVLNSGKVSGLYWLQLPPDASVELNGTVPEVSVAGAAPTSWSPTEGITRCTIDEPLTSALAANLRRVAPHANVMACPVLQGNGEILEVVGSPEVPAELQEKFSLENRAWDEHLATKLISNSASNLMVVVVQGETRTKALDVDLSAGVGNSYEVTFGVAQGPLHLDVQYTDAAGLHTSTSGSVSVDAPLPVLSKVQLGYGLVGRDLGRTVSAALMVSPYDPTKRGVFVPTVGLRFGGGEAVLGILGGARLGYRGGGLIFGLELGTENINTPWHPARDWFLGVSFDPNVIQAIRRENKNGG